MEANRRVRIGALLGALAGPPLAVLGLYEVLHRHFKSTGLGPFLILAGFVSAGLCFIGLPLLGASVLSGTWIGKKPARRLANYLIGASMGTFALISLLRLVVPDLPGGGEGTIFRIVRLQFGLVAGVLLCYRHRDAKPPAGRPVGSESTPQEPGAGTSPPDRRIRTGALIGALVGPIAVALVLGLLVSDDLGSMARLVPGFLLVPGIMLVGIGGVLGGPILGASIAARSWPPAEFRSRVANWSAMGGLLGAIAAGFLLGTYPHLGPGEKFVVVTAFMEAGLVVAFLLLLLFRAGRTPPPA